MYPKYTPPKYLNCDQCEIAVPLFVVENALSKWQKHDFLRCLLEGGEITVTCPACHDKNEEEEYRI